MTLATRKIRFSPLRLDGAGPPAIASGYYIIEPTAAYDDGAGRVERLDFQLTIDGVAVTVDLPVTPVTNDWAIKVVGNFPSGGGSRRTTEYVEVPAGDYATVLDFEDLPRLNAVDLTPLTSEVIAAWLVVKVAVEQSAASASASATSAATSANEAGSAATVAVGIAVPLAITAEDIPGQITAAIPAPLAAAVAVAVPPAAAGAILAADIPGQVATAVGAAPTVVAAAESAVDAEIATRHLVEGGSITAEQDVPLAFVVVDQTGRRTEIELGMDGKFTQRVIDSLSARIGLTTETPAELVAARGGQTDLTTRLDRGLTPYGSTRNYVAFEHNLRWTRMLTRKILYGEAAQFSVALIGDSYTFNTTRWSRPFWTAMKILYGDGPVGWVGFSNDLGTQGINGSVRSDVTVVETGAWTDTYTGTKSPDLGEEYSSTTGNTIVVTFPAGQNAADLFFIGTADGNITYQFNGGGTSQAKSLVAATTLQIAALTGITGTSTTLTITVVSGQVRLCGVNIKGSQSGVTVHKLGSTGSRASHWAAVNTASWNAGIASLNPDLVIIMLGTNDQASDAAPTFAGNMQTVLTNLRTSLGATGFDSLIVMPPENQAGRAVKMADYASAMLPIAAANQSAYIDTQSLFGELPADYAFGSARPWYSSDNIHPDPFTGGRVFADAIIRVVNDR